MKKDTIYYVGLQVDALSTSRLVDFFQLERSTRFQTTLIYSRSWFPYKGPEKKRFFLKPPYRIDCFNENTVLCLFSKELQDRHKELISLGAKSDFDKYRPHITIKGTVPYDKLPKFEIILTNEYYRTWIEE